jgi:hypothetical protein
MAEFIYIDNYSKTGKMGISVKVFEQIVVNALNKIPNVSCSSKKMKKNQNIHLNRPVQATIKKGIVHIGVFVDVKKEISPIEATSIIRDEIITSFMAVTDQVPFDIQVKVESLI